MGTRYDYNAAALISNLHVSNLSVSKLRQSAHLDKGTGTKLNLRIEHIYTG